MAELISSDAISQQFKRTQSMGGLLANFLTTLLKETLHTGFSYYSKEKCHEFTHGEGTCTKQLYRDDKCKCMYAFRASFFYHDQIRGDNLMKEWCNIEVCIIGAIAKKMNFRPIQLRALARNLARSLAPRPSQWHCGQFTEDWEWPSQWDCSWISHRQSSHRLFKVHRIIWIRHIIPLSGESFWSLSRKHNWLNFWIQVMLSWII